MAPRIAEDDDTDGLDNTATVTQQVQMTRLTCESNSLTRLHSGSKTSQRHCTERKHRTATCDDQSLQIHHQSRTTWGEKASSQKTKKHLRIHTQFSTASTEKDEKQPGQRKISDEMPRLSGRGSATPILADRRGKASLL